MARIAEILQRDSFETWRNSKEQRSGNNSLPLGKQDKSVCRICHGLGYLRQDLPVEHPDFGKVVLCVCRQSENQQKQLEDLRSLSNLKTMTRFTFELFNPDGYGLNEVRQRSLREAFTVAKAFAKNPNGWLILLGEYGCGKTHLAAAIANYGVSQNKPALFVVVPDLLDHLRMTYSPNNPIGYDQLFEQIRTAPLLILDDLGAHSSTPWAQEKLFQLFNYRYNAQLPTVVTSNHSLDELDIRIRSRIADPSLSRIITILAFDFRSGVVRTTSELSTLALHAEQTFENFNLRQQELTAEESENLRNVFNCARNFAEDTKDWLVLSGRYGCGKTHLAAAIANERDRQGDSVLFVVVPDLLDYLRAAYSPQSNVSYDKRFYEVRKSPLLIIDDLGTESATPWAVEKLYQLFDYRYNARLATVVTMASEATLHPRLKSLFLDIRRCTTWEIMASNYRGDLPSQPTRSRMPAKRR